MRRHLIASLALLLFPLVASALPPQTNGAVYRHFVLQSDAPLDAAATAELAGEGIDVQQPLANHRYLVRVRDGVKLPQSSRVRSLLAYDASRKIARSAYAEAANGKAFVQLRVLFQPEVTFADARSAIDAAGGTVAVPFALAADGPQRMTIRISPMAITQLANDERVFGVYGPSLRPRSLNSVAAAISRVTPLYTAPYNLTGDGVVLSLHEPGGPPDVSHPEFGGRVVSHFSPGRTADQHATHVTGTMVASGINARAKGMAPTASLHAYDANLSDADGNYDFAALMQSKLSTALVGSVADNNSWDFGVSWQGTQWWGNEDAYGAYSGLESEPYDRVMRTAGVPLVVHAAGNDATAGNPTLTPPWFPHQHIEDQSANGSFPHTYCYSQNGSGTDCPAPTCSAGTTYCEKTKHPTHGATTTIGLLASTKNDIAVGALTDDGVSIATFSSQGPATDGRVKPELVAKGYRQFSTIPNNSYTDGSNCSACPGYGTSMAAPVVTGIAGLVAQQYRKTFGKTPTASMLKTLLIAGAADLGNPGPDYIYGFGRVDAKTPVDLIIADGGTGSRIRTGAIANSQEIDIPISLPATTSFRVVLGWFDPEVLLIPANADDDPLAGKTLVNDLDLRVSDPNGAPVYPYVLNPNSPGTAATRAPNHTDTTEEIEIANAVAGTYHILIHGAIGDARSTLQDYVLVMSAGTPLPPCSDYYEPNDTQATAFGNLLKGQTVSSKICSAVDVDYFTFTSNSLAPISVSVTATDTPLKVTVSSSLSTTVIAQIPVNTTTKLDTFISTLVSPTPDVQFFVRIEPNGAVGATGAYSLTPTYSYNSTPRKHSTRR